jgi:hypothetical protein
MDRKPSRKPSTPLGPEKFTISNGIVAGDVICPRCGQPCAWIRGTEDNKSGRPACLRCLFDGPVDECSVKAGCGVPESAHDPVNHPHHYTSHPSGIECITIIEHFTHNVGAAVKYLWRAGLKRSGGTPEIEARLEDLRKAKWYISREIQRLLDEKGASK